MKNKILTYTMLLVLMVTTMGCKMENRKHLELKLAAKEIMRSCPFDCNGMGLIDSVVFQAPDFIYYLSLYEQDFTINDVRKHADDVKQGMLFNLLASYAYGEPEFINKLYNADANIKFVISGRNSRTSDETLDIVITTDDMQRIKDYPVNESKEQLQLQAMLCTQDLGLPQRLDEYTTLDSCRLVNNVLIYYYTLDDQVVDIELMRKGMSEIKQDMKQNLRASLNEPQTNKLLKVAVVVTDGVRSRFIGETTHSSLDVTLTVSDLEDILRR